MGPPREGSSGCSDRVSARGMGPAQCTPSARRALWPVTRCSTLVGFDGGITVITVWPGWLQARGAPLREPPGSRVTAPAAG